MWRALLDAAPDAGVVVDSQTRIQVINRRAAHVLGERPRELLRRSILDFVEGGGQPSDPGVVHAGRPDHADGTNAFLHFLTRCSGGDAPTLRRVTLRTRSGPSTFLMRGSALHIDDTRLIVLYWTEQPRTSRLFMKLNRRLEALHQQLDRERRLQNRLQRALGERELLVKEVHHRVRNNLQVINSFLNLQRRRDVLDVGEVLDETQARIQAIALVHDQLYLQGDVEMVDVGSLLHRLCQVLIGMYDRHDRTSLSISVTKWVLDVGRATPVALLVTEAVINALKHAFPDGRSGSITIESRRAEGARWLRIVDDGVGMPASRSNPRQPSVGLDLMEALARQVQGTLEIGGDEGVEIRLAIDGADNWELESRRMALPDGSAPGDDHRRPPANQLDRRD